MARRQTTVYLSDEMVALLDERAARTGRSRSEVIRAAVEHDLAAERDALIDSAIVAGYTRIPPPLSDPWAEAAAVRAIAAEPW